MNPWVILAVVLAFGAATGGAYMRGREDGKDSEIAIAAREKQIGANAADAAASAAAAAISRITVKHQTIKQELEREIRTNPVYLRPDCATGADSLQRFNAAIPTSPEQVPDSSVVPTPDTSIGRFTRRLGKEGL